MPEDLDLRGLHGRHEPDPEFRLELRRQVEEIVTGSTGHTLIDPTDLQEDAIMLTDTRTEPSATPPRSRRWLLPAAAAVVVGIVVGIAVLGGGDDEGEIDTADSTIVFHDDFSDDTGAWETFEFVEVEDGHQVWRIEVPGETDFLKPLPTEHRLVDMEVSAAVASVDPDSTVGLYCRKGAGNQDYYYFFRLAPQGAVVGILPPEPDAPGVVLAEDPSFTRPGGPFELTARCVDDAGVAELTLLVDGQVVLEGTHDAPLPDGYGAIEVQAGARGSAPSEVRIDEFTVAAP